MEPRHFWRRFIALVIDFILLSQLAFFLAVPFANGESLRLSGGLYQSISCNVVSLEENARAYFSGQGISAEKGSLCVSYQNGFYAGSDLLVSSETNEAGEIADTATTITVSINRAGERIIPVFPVVLLAPLSVLLGMILMTWLWRGQTVGKKITGVRVVPGGGEDLGFVQAAKREMLKFAPAILLFTLGMLAPDYTLERVVPVLQNGENAAMALLVLGASTFMYILWWVAPLIWWNGAMPYDRFIRTAVVRATR